MIVFFISFLFAVAQILLLKNLLVSITSGLKKKAILFFLIKFVLYGIGIATFMYKFYGSIIYCILGFAAGMPLAAFVIFIYDTFIKKQ